MWVWSGSLAFHKNKAKTKRGALKGGTASLQQGKRGDRLVRPPWYPPVTLLRPIYTGAEPGSILGLSQVLPGAVFCLFHRSRQFCAVQGSARQLLDAIKQTKRYAWQLLACLQCGLAFVRLSDLTTARNTNFNPRKLTQCAGRKIWRRKVLTGLIPVGRLLVLFIRRQIEEK